jgi:nucleotide-binding universal stress UspA family protein
MFKTILVPTDGSPLSDKAIHAAIELAKISSGKIIGLSVAEPYPFSTLYQSTATTDANAYEEKMHERAEQHVQKIAAMATKENIPCETVVTQSFSPYEEIIATARHLHCDLNKLFLGSETQKVLAHTTLPVLVFRGENT